jgi:hypothetical protein
MSTIFSRRERAPSKLTLQKSSLQGLFSRKDRDRTPSPTEITPSKPFLKENVADYLQSSEPVLYSSIFTSVSTVCCDELWNKELEDAYSAFCFLGSEEQVAILCLLLQRSDTPELYIYALVLRSCMKEANSSGLPDAHRLIFNNDAQYS